MYIYTREHDQARAYVVYSSPETHACRGDMQAWAHTKNKKQQQQQQQQKNQTINIFL